MPDLVVEAVALREAVHLVAHAAPGPRNPSKLHQILLEGDAEGFRVLASDNYRIAIVAVPLAADSPAAADWGRRCIRPERVAALRHLLASARPADLLHLRTISEPATAFGTQDWLEFRTREGVLRVAELKAVQVPDYRSVLPTAAPALTIGLDLRFLKELGGPRRYSPSQVLIRLRDATTPVEFEIERLHYREFVMPLRLDLH